MSSNPEIHKNVTTTGTSESSTSHAALNNTNLIDCKLIALLPFTYYDTDVNPYKVVGGRVVNFPYTHMAAAVMAIDHFNQRDNAVVKDIEEQVANCSVFMPDPVFFNTNGDKVSVAVALVQAAYHYREYCGIVGPWGNPVATEASSIASGLDIPMITHRADDASITQVHESPRVLSTYASMMAQADVLTDWFLHNGRTDFMAVIAPTLPFGADFADRMENSAKKMGFKHMIFYSLAPPFSGFEPNAGAGYALQQVKEKGYRNIFLVLEPLEIQLPYIANYAEQFGLNTGDHVWMLSSNNDLTEVAHLAQQNENITKLVRGMAVLRCVDGFSFHEALSEEDSFLQAWREQDELFVDRINSIHPIQDPKAPGYFQPDGNYFLENDHEFGAGYMYDAVMLQGIGRCQQERNDALRQQQSPPTHSQDGGGSETSEGGDPPPPHAGAPPGGSETSEGGAPPPPNAGAPPPEDGGVQRRMQNERRIKGVKTTKSKPNSASIKASGETRILQEKKKRKEKRNDHQVGIMGTTFDGATGTLLYESKGGYRARYTIRYGVYNFRETEPNEISSDEDYSTWYYLTDVLTEVREGERTWMPTIHAPFIFPNGLTTPPLRNYDLPEQNYLSRGVRIFGLTMFLIAGLLCAESLLFVKVNSAKPAILQAQPTFLYLMLAGCFILSGAMLTFSFDEGSGWTDQMLDRACMVTPWLLAIGYNSIYCALVCKLWRINKVLQAGRRRVEVHHAVGPFLAVVLCNVLVLLVWTVVDPFTWVRTTIDDDTLEEYGRCTSDHSTVFVVVLAGLMACCSIACATMAWKTKDIDKRFSESSWIFYTIFVQAQVLLLGIPVLIILGTASADATYLGRVTVIFLLIFSTITMMIGPKVLRFRAERASGRSDNSSRRSYARGSVGGGVHVTGLSEPSMSMRGNAHRQQLSISQLSMGSHLNINTGVATSTASEAATFNMESGVITSNVESEAISTTANSQAP